ncbi:MAG: S-layer family protein [Leptolyngbyaceae cyanobacterium SM2_5_2]|nr:S-layer family protein [Leptolyngbyaceae cyanobacterium SM2_5_2]
MKLPNFLGTANARGGANSGNGGLVEISAVGRLHYNGQADTRAPQGTVGLLLLDPTTLEIVAVGEDTTDLTLVDEFGDSDLDPATQRTRIAASALETALSNVVLQATEDIIVNADVFMIIPGVGLTAQAGRDIIVNRYIQAAGGGDLSFLAGRNLTFNSTDAYAWSYGGDIVLNAGETVSLLSGAQADTAPFDGDSGNLNLAAQRLIMTDGSQLKTGPFFSGAGGNLTINVADAIELSGIGFDGSGNFGSTGFIASSLLFGSTGTSGTITVQAPTIRLLNGAALGAQSLNDQPGGHITVSAPNLIQISGVAPSPTGEFRSSISASSSSNAAAGQIALQTSQLVIEGGGFVGASGMGLSGPGGVVTINAEQIQMNGRSPSGEPSGVFTRSFTLADAGDVFINNSGNITLDNGALIDVSSLGFGAGGQLSIKTHDLKLNNNSIIFAGSLFGSADRVDVVASGTVSLNNNSTLFGDTLGQGSGASISIQTGRLEVFNRSFISTATLEAGGGGNLNIQASEAVELANGFLSTGTFDAGNGGNLIIRTPTLLIDEGLVESNSFGSGIAGNVDLNVGNLIIRDSGEVSVRGFSANARTGNILIVADTILLENEGKILASAPSTNGGNIDLTANQRLLLRGNSLISANAGDPLDLIAPPPGTGNGGNIRISAPFVIAVREENSDIVATASLGNGGRVAIVTRGLFGLEFRDQRTPLSDITASSEFGLSGTVDINALDTTAIENSLVGLPELPLTTDALVSGSCLAPQEGTPSTFVITGAGGLPTQPDSGRVSTFPTGEVRGVDEPAVTEQIRPVWQPGDPIMEPTGVYQLDNGRWVLGRACQ